MHDSRRVPRRWDFAAGASFVFLQTSFGRGLKLPN